MPGVRASARPSGAKPDQLTVTRDGEHINIADNGNGLANLIGVKHTERGRQRIRGSRRRSSDRHAEVTAGAASGARVEEVVMLAGVLEGRSHACGRCDGAI